MPKKSKTVFICQNCGAQSPRWVGQCPQCGQWNTFEETLQETPAQKKTAAKAAAQVEVTTIAAVLNQPNRLPRISTGIGEVDRVLGMTFEAGKEVAGLVPGSVILIGGEPGIGKSTLITQIIINLLKSGQKIDKDDVKLSVAKNSAPGQILYVCGEESPYQVGGRVSRLIKNYSTDENSVDDSDHPLKNLDQLMSRLSLTTETDVDNLCSFIHSTTPTLVVVDSIQTITTSDLTGTAGSLGQLRESTLRLTTVCKSLHIPLLLVGHVTKEGAIAGPKVLEHMVDAVLELSGERSGQFRTLRSIKNRFGATDEVGLFSMQEIGLQEVTNPSELFIQQGDEKIAGSAIISTIEGTRPLLLEVQALVIPTQLAIPRRVGQGVAAPRLQVLTAVLQKHARLTIGQSDIFVNIAGGFSVKEPAVDLGICLAIASSHFNQPLPPQSVAIGEVGLLGEIRPVSFMDKRITEAGRLGFSTVYSAKSSRSLGRMIKEIFKK